MPIIASLGALSYQKFQLSDFDYWIVTTDSDKLFSDIEFDDEDAFYIVGNQSQLTAGNTFFNVSKFKQFDSVPYLLSTSNYRITSATSSEPRPVLNCIGRSIKFNPNTDILSVLTSTRIGYPFTFPNPYRTVPFSFQIKKDLTRQATTGRVDFGEDPLVNDLIFDNFTEDTSDTHYFYIGHGGTPDASIVVRKENFNSQGGAPPGTTITTDEEIAARRIEGSRPAGSIYDIALNSSGDPITIGNTSNNVYVIKFDQTPTTVGSIRLLNLLWGNVLSFTSQLISRGLILDNPVSGLNNIYGVLYSPTETSSYVIKYEDNGTSSSLAWQRKIEGVNLFSITVDDVGNFYIVGNKNNDLFLAKYNTNGILQWQNILSGINFTPTKITIKDDLYILGNISSNGFVLKLPEDGSIPGNGNYNISSTTVTYQSGSQSEVAGALTNNTFSPDLIGQPTRTTASRVNEIFATTLETNINSLN